MSIGLPFVFVLFVIQFAAGLLVYWIATNLTMIPQQFYMLRKYGRPNVPVTVEPAARQRSRRRRATPRRGDRRQPSASRRRVRAAPAEEAIGEAAVSVEVDDELDPGGGAPRAARDAGGGVRRRRASRDVGGATGCAGPSRARAPRRWSAPTATVIEAVQHLAQRIVLRGAGGLRVVVDAAGYRGRREEALRVEADRVADRVVERGARDRDAADAGGGAALRARVPARARRRRHAQRRRRATPAPGRLAGPRASGRARVSRFS